MTSFGVTVTVNLVPSNLPMFTKIYLVVTVVREASNVKSYLYNVFCFTAKHYRPSVVYLKSQARISASPASDSALAARHVE